MAYIHHTYADGSISMGYESGDKVAAREDIFHYDIAGKQRSVTSIGEIVTIKRPVEISAKPFQDYFAKSRSCTTFIVYTYQLEPLSIVNPKPKPPILYVIPWHEGTLTKYARVLAFSPSDATSKLYNNVYKMRGNEDGWTIYDPTPYDDYKKTGKEVWIGFLGI